MKKLELLLNEKTILFRDDISTWQEAIREASKPLLEAKSIEEKYVLAMIDAVETYGPYMVLKDYFALMHARSECGVNETAMSMLILKDAIMFKDKAVKIFLVLAAKNNSEHLNALSCITQLFLDEDTYNKFLKSSKNEILEILKGGK